jgi:hypothetical protein
MFSAGLFHDSAADSISARVPYGRVHIRAALDHVLTSLFFSVAFRILVLFSFLPEVFWLVASQFMEYFVSI